MSTLSPVSSDPMRARPRGVQKQKNFCARVTFRQRTECYSTRVMVDELMRRA
jgi:hypothetical protein